MQKIVLIIEPNECPYETPSKIGNLFMNRFTIDEDGNFEILKVLLLKNNYSDYIQGYLNPTEGKGPTILVFFPSNRFH